MSIQKRFRLAIIITAAMPTISLPVIAQAQENIEEIIVTARKREESLMKIPVSVNVVDSVLIQAANLNSAEDIALITPGFKMNSAFGRQADRAVIRGVSSIFTGQDLVGYFVDGVYFTGSISSLGLDSVERVEVLKGPQSASFGRRTFSGAINYVMQKPTKDTTFKVKAELGSNSHQVLSATASGSSGKFGYRANIRSYQYDGDFDNALPSGPNNIGGEETLSASGTFYFDPSEDTSIEFSTSYADDDDQQYAISIQPTAENNCTFGTTSYYCGVVNSNAPVSLGGFRDASTYGVQRERFRSSLKIVHDFGPAELTWISSYNTLNEYVGQDQTFNGLQAVFSFGFFSGGPFLVPATDWHTLDASETDDVSHEVWLRGAANNDRLSWSIGAYLYDEDSEGFESDGFRNKIGNQALMGAIDYEFSDVFRAGLELRWAEDEIDQKPEFSTTQFSDTFDSVTHRLTLSWDVAESTMLYANWSTGTLPGEFNTNANLPPELIPIDEGELEQIEVGVKSSITDALNVTAAVYTQEWSDQRRNEFIIINGIAQGYQANQGTTEFTGVELSANWQATDKLTLTGAFSFNDSEIKNFISTDTTDVAITGDGDVSGAQAPLSPEKEAHVSANYSVPFQNGMELSARVDVGYQSTRFARTVNLAETGSATVANLNVSLSRDNWRIALWGKNVTDEDAAVSVLRYIEPDSFLFGNRAFAVTPRKGPEYGVTFTAEF